MDIDQLRGRLNSIYRDKILKEYDKPLETVFTPEAKYTFLVGAGISMGPPTSISSARQFVHHLLQFYAPSHDVEPLEKLKDLRYEIIVDKIQEFFDKDIKFLDYLEDIKEPNLIHYFLAYAILRGHNVITTNFDYMIELALKNILPEAQHNNIIPVITNKDFLQCRDPEVLKTQNKYLVYKIHGSKKNIITGQSTKDSLITTISSLGKNRGESVTFAVEEYKKESFENLLKNRTLIIMGYSGSDDFDISPTLKMVPDIACIIWLEHLNFDKTEVLAIRSESEGLQNYLAQGTDALLANIKVQKNVDIFKILTPTLPFLKKTLWLNIIPDIKIDEVHVTEPTERRIEFGEWMKPNLKAPSTEKKYRFSCEIFSDSGRFELVKRSAEIGIKEDDLYTKEYSHLCLGVYFNGKGDYDKALDHLEKSIELAKKLEYDLDLAWGYNLLGLVYFSRDLNIEKGLELLEKALEINKRVGDKFQYSSIIRHIGDVYQYKRDYERALELFTECLKIDSEEGRLNNKADSYFRIGRLYLSMKNTDKAYEYLAESLKIAKQLGDHKVLTASYYMLGYYYDLMGTFGKALNHYQAARKSGYIIKDFFTLIQILQSLAKLVSHSMFAKQTWDYLNEALELAKNLGDFPGKSYLLADVAGIYKKEEKYEDALDYYREALNNALKFKDTFQEGYLYSEIAKIYGKKEQYHKAIEYFNKSKLIYEKTNLVEKLEVIDYNIEHYKNKLEKLSLSEEDLNKIEPSLSTEKNSFIPQEKISVKYTAPLSFDKTAWIGLIPSDIAHNDEALADEHDIAYYYLEKSTSGRVNFKAPADPGSYDFRLFDKNGDGNEVLSIKITVETLEIGLVLRKDEYKIHEVIRVSFVAEPSFAEFAWIALVPSEIPHDDPEASYQFALDTKNLEGKIHGEYTFYAPEISGKYEVRMFEHGKGKEITSVQITVKE